jgi:hypothetical protein
MNHEMFVEDGDTVEYFFGGDISGDAHPAIVVKHGMGTKLDLGRLDPAFADMHLRDGVPHVDDKQTAQAEKIEAGGWRMRKKDMAIRKAMFDLGLARWNEEKRVVEYAPFKEDSKRVEPAKKSA